MIKIGILSDTHGYVPESVIHFLSVCDEIWHAGDWGADVYELLKPIKPLRGVYGNIDGKNIRMLFPEINQFQIENTHICMLHIGGYPGKYSSRFKEILKNSSPQLMVCGHSHILKVIHDKERNMLHINPGAAGIHGFHQAITAVRLDIQNGIFRNLEVFETRKVIR